MELLRLLRRQMVCGIVGIPFRAERGADHDRAAGHLLSHPRLLGVRDAAAICLGEVVEGVPELRTPGRIRTPRISLEDEARSVRPGGLEVRREVLSHRLAALVGLEQREGGEARQVDAVMEDERRLGPAVAEEDLPLELW